MPVPSLLGERERERARRRNLDLKSRNLNQLGSKWAAMKSEKLIRFANCERKRNLDVV